MQRRVRIGLSANIKDYTVKIKTCDKCIVENINTYKTCLNFSTKDRFVKLVISPVGDKYYTMFYYNLDLRCACCYNLSFNFALRENQLGSINTFYLTDRIYGFKINGELNFNKV